MGQHAKILRALGALYRSGLIRTLTRKELKLYLLLLFSKKRVVSRQAMRALSRNLEVSETRLNRAMSRLERIGLIRIRPHPRRGRGQASALTVTIEPARRRR